MIAVHRNDRSPNMSRASQNLLAWLFTACGIIGLIIGEYFLIVPVVAIASTRSDPWWPLIIFVPALVAFPAIMAWLVLKRVRTPGGFAEQRLHLSRLCLLLGVLEALGGPVLWVILGVLATGLHSPPTVHVH